MGVFSDLVQSHETVRITDSSVIKVYGLSIDSVVRILTRFPEVAKMFDRREASVPQLLVELPGVCAAVMAAGVGRAGEADEELAASQMPIEIQVDVLESVFRQTFRSGFGPFADRLAKLLSGGTLGPLTTSRRPSQTSQPAAA